MEKKIEKLQKKMIEAKKNALQEIFLEDKLKKFKKIKEMEKELRELIKVEIADWVKKNY
jgi:dTDP-4-amino-4,6-dideoxygalactose transaminase